LSDSSLTEDDSSSDSGYDSEEVENSKKRCNWIMHPENPMRLKWSLFVNIFLVLTIFLTPVNLAFSNDSNEMLLVEICIDFIFIIDIVMNFRYAYVDKNLNMVTDQSKISKGYLKSWFIADLLSVLPLSYVF
jgi:hypothetical protein